MTWWLYLSWALIALCAASAAGTLGCAYRRRRMALALLEEDRGESFSMESYRPLEALLAEKDFEYLRKQPGYTAEMGVRWKRESRRILRLYLQELSADFYRLHQAAREMVAHAGPESSALVGALIRQELAFSLSLIFVECRLALHAAGIGHVKVLPLINLVEAARLDLARLAPQPA